MSEKAGIKLNTKTWHYKLIKFVLGSAAPTPQNMHNLCPYFWLLIFSMFAAPFWVFGKVTYKILEWMLNGLVTFTEFALIEPTAANWARGLNDKDAYLLFQNERKIPALYHKAKLGKNANGYEKSRNEIVREWFLRTHKMEMYVLTKNGEPGNGFSDEFIKWKNTEQLKRRTEEVELEKLLAERRANRTIKVEEVGESVGRAFDSAVDYMKSLNTIIKWTKRFVGGIITLSGLGLVYFFVNYIGRGMLWIVENFNGPVVLDNLLIFGAIVLAAVLLIGIIFLLRLWVLYVKEQGLKLWYVKMIYYPLYWFIFLPFKFIFADFIFDFLIINIFKGIIAGVKGVWFGLLGFMGIFGEYFGASYTDYCPGIEWDENQVEETKE